MSGNSVKGKWENKVTREKDLLSGQERRAQSSFKANRSATPYGKEKSASLLSSIRKGQSRRG